MNRRGAGNGRRRFDRIYRIFRIGKDGGGGEGEQYSIFNKECS
jgi:hypothetical protein